MDKSALLQKSILSCVNSLPKASADEIQSVCFLENGNVQASDIYREMNDLILNGLIKREHVIHAQQKKSFFLLTPKGKSFIGQNGSEFSNPHPPLFQEESSYQRNVSVIAKELRRHGFKVVRDVPLGNTTISLTASKRDDTYFILYENEIKSYDTHASLFKALLRETKNLRFVAENPNIKVNIVNNFERYLTLNKGFNVAKQLFRIDGQSFSVITLSDLDKKRKWPISLE